MSKVTIKNSGHTFDVRPSQTVLQAAIEAGVNLPYGCRNGACGACKAEVIAGKVMHDDYQGSAMSDTELAADRSDGMDRAVEAAVQEAQETSY